MTASKIEWTERSDWNPIRGCTRVSEGCRNCYAEQIAGRFSDPGQAFHGFAERTSKGGRWTGKVALVEDRLTLPLRWRKPALIFASSTSDIFHESLSDADIDRIFAVMALAPQHRFQVLTKRAERMREYLTRFEHRPDQFGKAMASVVIAAGLPQQQGLDALDAFVWPLPNVWQGVSVEDQAAADERIPHLLATPAAVWFLSCEPLLGPVRPWTFKIADAVRALGADVDGNHDTPGIDWVIAGGESGRGARPMHPDWARSLRDQCAAAGVPFFFKQWGEWQPADAGDHPADCVADRYAAFRPDKITTYSTSDAAYWATRAGEQGMCRVGKAAAGRLLDGAEHSGMPE